MTVTGKVRKAEMREQSVRLLGAGGPAREGLSPRTAGLHRRHVALERDGRVSLR